MELGRVSTGKKMKTKDKEWRWKSAKAKLHPGLSLDILLSQWSSKWCPHLKLPSTSCEVKGWNSSSVVLMMAMCSLGWVKTWWWQDCRSSGLVAVGWEQCCKTTTTVSPDFSHPLWQVQTRMALCPANWSSSLRHGRQLPKAWLCWPTFTCGGSSALWEAQVSLLLRVTCKLGWIHSSGKSILGLVLPSFSRLHQ